MATTKYVHNPKHIVNFCNIVMRSEPQGYIKIIAGKRQFDATKMANEFIYQHALEKTDAYQDILRGVLVWWEGYIGREKLLKQQ